MVTSGTGQNIVSTIATAGSLTLLNAKISNTNGATDAAGVGAPAIATGQSNGTPSDPLAGLVLPGEGGLFSPNPSPSAEHPYLIETDPRLVDINNLYGSDYFLEQVGYDPEADTAIFLGDAYYEQRVIAEQVRESLGTRYIFNNVTNDNDQYRNLAEQAAVERDRLGLEFGSALTTAQINELDQDIVWYVETDFNGISVLAPRLYVSQATRDARRLNGATIMAADIDIDGASLLNEGNIIASKSMDIDVEGDLVNLGGSISSGDSMAINTGGDFISESTTWEFEGGVTKRSGIASAASVISGGNMSITSDGSINLIGSELAAGGDASLQADKELNIAAIALTNTGHRTENGVNYAEVSNTNVVSNLDIGGNLNLSSGQDMTLEGTGLKVGGDAALASGGNVNILAVQNETTTETHTERHGFFSSSSTTTNTRDVTNTVASLDIGGGLSITAANDVVLEGTRVDAGGALALQSGGDINLLAVQDSSESTTQTNKSGVFYSSETTEKESSSINQLVTLKAGTDLAIDSGNNIMVMGADITAEGNASLNTNGGDISIIAVKDIVEESKKSRSKDFLYTETEDSGKHTETVIASSITSGGNLNINTTAADRDAGGNVTIAGSNINSGGDLGFGDKTLATNRLDDSTTTGMDNLTITTVAANDKEWSIKERELNGGLATLLGVVASALGADVEMESSQTNESESTTQVGSRVDTAGDLNIHTRGDTTIAGSSVDVAGNAEIQTGGNFNVIAAIDTSSTRESESRTALEGMSIEITDSRASIGIDGTKTSTSHEENSQTVAASSLNIGGSLNLDAGDKISIVGSDISSEGNMILDAKKGVEIVSAEEVTETLDKEFEGKARLSVGVGNAYLDAANAHKAWKAARQATSEAKQALREFDAEVAQMQKNLANGTVTQADIDARQKDRRLFLANIDAARVNEVSKLAAVGSSGTTAVSSTGTAGFYADVQYETSGTETSRNSTETTARGSKLSSLGGNVVIRSGDNIDIEGSDIEAVGYLVLDAENDINIIAAKETKTTQESSNSSNMSVSVGMYGQSANNNSLGGGANSSHAESEALTHRLSSLVGGAVMMRSGADTDIVGAYVDGGILDMDVGGDLTVASVQNTYTSKSTGSGFNISISNSKKEGAKKSSNSLGSIGANVNEETIDRAWVDQRTTLIGRDGVNINVGDETTLTAATIVQVDYEGIEGNKLTINTGSLTVNELNDRDITERKNAGFTYGGSSTSIQVGNDGKVAKQTGYSVIGQGEINLTKSEEIDGNLKRTVEDETQLVANRNAGGLNLDVKIDHNLVTEEGRKKIAVNLIETGMHTTDIVVVGVNYLGDDEMGFKDAQNMIKYGHKQRTGQQNALDSEKARKGLNHADASAAEVKDGMQNLANEILGNKKAQVYVYDGQSSEVGVDVAGAEYNKNTSAAGYDNNSGNIVINTSGLNVDMTSTDQKIEMIAHEGVHAYSNQNDVSMNHDTEEGLAGYYGGQARITYGMYSALGGYETDVGGANIDQSSWMERERVRDGQAPYRPVLSEGNRFVRGVDSANVDPLTIFIHGTNATDSDYTKPGSPFYNSVAGTFNEIPVEFNWSGDNTTNARKVAAIELQLFIEEKIQEQGGLAPGERINMVVHSHGGNVKNEYTQLDGARRLGVVVDLGTPQTPQHQLNPDMVDTQIHVYSDNDWVQPMGGDYIKWIDNHIDNNVIFEMSDPFNQLDRINENAINIDASTVRREQHGRNGTYSAPVGHPDLHTPSVWQQHVAPVVQEQIRLSQ